MTISFLMGAFGNLVALLTGVNVTRQEVKDGTIFSVLSKPVTRLEYVLGSFVGGLSTLLLTWSVLGSVFMGLAYLVGQHPGRTEWMMLLGRLTLSVLLFSLAFCFAQRFSAWIAAALSIAVYEGDSVVGLITFLLERMRIPLTQGIKRALAFPFPATSGLDPIFGAFFRSPLRAPSVAWVFLHLLDYAALLVLLAWWIFHRQDLNQAAE